MDRKKLCRDGELKPREEGFVVKFQEQELDDHISRMC